MFYLELLQTALLAAVVIALYRGVFTTTGTGTVKDTDSDSSDNSSDNSPTTPPNVSHRWDIPLVRPAKAPRPVPTPRGNCAFRVKRGDQIIGTRPAGHPDELEALSCDRLHVEYLEGDNS